MYSVYAKSVEYIMNIKKPRKKLRQISKIPKNAKISGHETTKDLKKDIQALVREIAILRDGGCVLRHYPEAGRCGWLRKDGQLILQAEHLITRGNSSTYGDMRNIVCLCAYHHTFFKPRYSKLYWDLIQKHLGEKRWKWFELAESDKKAYKVDWKLVKIALTQELEKMKKDQDSTFTFEPVL